MKIPKSFDRFSFLSNSLGLSYNRRALPTYSISQYSSSGAGLRSLVNDSCRKVLVEVILARYSLYGRDLVLVCLGVGCTVWYKYAYSTDGNLPSFKPLDSYDPFFKMEYYSPDFSRISFVESHDVSASVESTFENQLPFAEIKIPASGYMLQGVGLGLIVAFLLGVGLVPNHSGANNVLL